ncbi:MAG: DinB family protein [Chitinophagaceae bacterium]
MIKEALLGEFLHEAENTRKLLNAIPDSALDYRPQPHLWSVGQLASHIAEVYNWFDCTFNMDVFDMGTYKYDKGEISKASNIVAKFEENLANAKAVLENSDESNYFNTWTMQMGGVPIMPPMPKIQVARGFLFNHLYHHRGELVSHLRATGNKVPGLYGPSYEEAQAMMAQQN